MSTNSQEFKSSETALHDFHETIFTASDPNIQICPQFNDFLRAFKSSITDEQT